MSLFARSVRGHADYQQGIVVESCQNAGTSKILHERESEYLVELYSSSDVHGGVPSLGWVTENVLSETKNGKRLIAAYRSGKYFISNVHSDSKVIQEFTLHCEQELLLEELDIKGFVRDPDDARRLCVVVGCNSPFNGPTQVCDPTVENVSMTPKGRSVDLNAPSDRKDHKVLTSKVDMSASQHPNVLIPVDMFEKAYPHRLLVHLLQNMKWT